MHLFYLSNFNFQNSSTFSTFCAIYKKQKHAQQKQQTTVRNSLVFSMTLVLVSALRNSCFLFFFFSTGFDLLDLFNAALESECAAGRRSFGNLD